MFDIKITNEGVEKTPREPKPIQSIQLPQHWPTFPQKVLAPFWGRHQQSLQYISRYSSKSQSSSSSWNTVLLNRWITKNPTTSSNRTSLSLHSCQHGFRAINSCESKLFNFSSLADYLRVINMMLTWCKAFDWLPHARLLKKLEFIGLHEQILKLVHIIQQDRTQWRVVDCGASEFLWGVLIPDHPNHAQCHLRCHPLTIATLI